MINGFAASWMFDEPWRDFFLLFFTPTSTKCNFLKNLSRSRPSILIRLTFVVNVNDPQLGTVKWTEW